MADHKAPTGRSEDPPAARNPHRPASLLEDDNIRAAAQGMPGKRDALPPGTLPRQTPDAQGDQNMEPVVQPGRGSPRTP